MTLEQAIYKKSQENILEAVNIARDLVKSFLETLTPQNKKDFGNLRGLRGWLTHLALYLLGGKGGLPQTTVKNITPILLKSPQDVAIAYGMTPAEKQYYLDNRKAMLQWLIDKTSRTDVDINDAFHADVVAGKAKSEAYASGTANYNKYVVAGDTADVAFGKLTTREQDALTAYWTNLGRLSDITSEVAYANKPVPGAQPVGPVRKGSSQVGAIPSVTTPRGERRGGVVVEFRNLPGFYDGPAKWKALGQDFFKAAEERNKRSGIKP